VLSLTPGNRLPDLKIDWISIDTFFHLIFYLVLSFLMLIARYKNDKKVNQLNFELYSNVIVAGLLIGFVIELMQEYLIYMRYFSLKDIIANSFGTIFGVIVFRLTSKKLIKI
jgi:glycopeptide antibiotics resistance protein